MMRLHFPTESRWNPYVGAGAHYVNAPGVERATSETWPAFKLPGKDRVHF